MPSLLWLNNRYTHRYASGASSLRTGTGFYLAFTLMALFTDDEWL